MIDSRPVLIKPDDYSGDALHCINPMFGNIDRLPVTLPPSQKGLEGLGWSIGDIKNDIVDGVYTQRIGIIDLGILDWTPNTSRTAYQTTNTDIPNFKQVQNMEKANIVTLNYTTVAGNSASGTDGTICCLNIHSLRVGIIDEMPKGIMYYELATPITIDINKMVEWNQLYKWGRPSSSTTFQGLTITKIDELHFIINGRAGRESYFTMFQTYYPFVIGHYYYFNLINGLEGLTVFGVRRLPMKVIRQATTSQETGVDFTEDTQYIDRLMTLHTVDLTLIFGEGNEPTSVDDERIKAIERYVEKHPNYTESDLISLFDLYGNYIDRTPIIVHSDNKPDLVPIEFITEEVTASANLLSLDAEGDKLNETANIIRNDSDERGAEAAI